MHKKNVRVSTKYHAIIAVRAANIVVRKTGVSVLDLVRDPKIGDLLVLASNSENLSQVELSKILERLSEIQFYGQIPAF